MKRLVAFELGRELGKYEASLVAMGGKDDELFSSVLG